jgi:hypothetical protein
VWLRLYSNGGWCGVRDTKRLQHCGYSFIFVFFVFFYRVYNTQPHLTKKVKTIDIQKLFQSC